MAKTKHHPSTALATLGHRGAAPIIVRETRTVTRSPRKGKGKRHHRRGGHMSSEKVLMGLAVGGFAMGFLDKPGGPGANIPTIPLLGKAGTIAVVAHFFGKGKGGIITDIRNAAAVVAAYEFGLKGSVSGDEV